MSNDLSLPAHARFKNLTDCRFGRLVVVSYAGLNSWTPPRHCWNCVCDCGCKIVRTTLELTKTSNSNNQSCGCWGLARIKQLKFRHGLRGTAEYRAWQHMKSRCYNNRNNDYQDYGGRGIIVCDSWRDSFEQFLQDMGRKPTAGHSIDRKNTNGNYAPENCRWATPLEQAQNKRNNVNIEWRGRSQGLAAWARELGIAVKTLTGRFSRGWSVEKAFTEPLHTIAQSLSHARECRKQS